jgi:predicted TIM-barrel fold metal-dependent hydrolase
MSDHWLISADSHVNEPRDLWTSRVAAKYNERAPRIAEFELGDAWVIEGSEDPITFGLNASAGMLPNDVPDGGWMRYSDMRPGGYDPAARLEEMNADGVDAEVLYPTPRLAQGMVSAADTDFHLALIRAYNDWLSEYVSYAPDRFGGLALLPNRGASLAVEEFKRVINNPGIRGVTIGAYPNGTLELAPEDDEVWGVLADAGVPVSIHVLLSLDRPAANRRFVPAAGRFNDAPSRIVQFVFTGVLDRFPDLDLVFAEVEIGWVPHFKEALYNNFRRLANPNYKGRLSPIEYIERNVHFTYITDAFGLKNRHAVGVEHILWSSDYPHSASDWPTSWRTIEASMSDIPSAERQLMLAGNADRLYRFSS